MEITLEELFLNVDAPKSHSYRFSFNWFRVLLNYRVF